MGKIKVTDEMVQAFKVALNGPTLMSDATIKVCLQAALDARDKKPVPEATSVLAALTRVLPLDAARQVVAHRNGLRRPMTVRAAELLAREFEKLDDPKAGADMMIMRGWQGFEAAWYNKERASFGGSYQGRGLAGARSQLMQEFEDDRYQAAQGHHSQNAGSLSVRR